MGKSGFRRVPKQARSQERFDQILDVAAKLFSEKGFDATTTNEIARRAGVSIGSVYQYFDDKEAIVEDLADRYVEALRVVTNGLLTTDIANLSTVEAVDRLLDPILEFHSNHPAFSPLWLGAEVSSELKTSMGSMDIEVLARVEELIKGGIPGISHERALMVATSIQAAVKSLLGILSRTDDAEFRQETTSETKRMLVAYLEDVIRRQTS